MQRVGTFLGLPQYNFSTSIAYNTEKRRGAYIATSNGHGGSGGTAAAAKSTGINNEASAASASKQRSSAAAADLAVVANLVKHSVGQLQTVLADPSWAPSAMQLRREVPPSWRERYLR